MSTQPADCTAKEIDYYRMQIRDAAQSLLEILEGELAPNPEQEREKWGSWVQEAERLRILVKHHDGRVFWKAKVYQDVNPLR